MRVDQERTAYFVSFLRNVSPPVHPNEYTLSFCLQLLASYAPQLRDFQETPWFGWMTNYVLPTYWDQTLTNSSSQQGQTITKETQVLILLVMQQFQAWSSLLSTAQFIQKIHALFLEQPIVNFIWQLIPIDVHEKQWTSRGNEGPYTFWIFNQQILFRCIEQFSLWGESLLFIQSNIPPASLRWMMEKGDIVIEAEKRVLWVPRKLYDLPLHNNQKYIYLGPHAFALQEVFWKTNVFFEKLVWIQTSSEEKEKMVFWSLERDAPFQFQVIFQVPKEKNRPPGLSSFIDHLSQEEILFFRENVLPLYNQESLPFATASELSQFRIPFYFSQPLAKSPTSTHWFIVHLPLKAFHVKLYLPYVRTDQPLARDQKESPFVMIDKVRYEWIRTVDRHLARWVDFLSSHFVLLLARHGSYSILFLTSRVATFVWRSKTVPWDYEAVPGPPEGWSIPRDDFLLPLHYSGLMFVPGSSVYHQLLYFMWAIEAGKSWCVEKLIFGLLHSIHSEDNSGHLKPLFKQCIISYLKLGTPYRHLFRYYAFSIWDDPEQNQTFKQVKNDFLARRMAYPPELLVANNTQLFLHGPSTLSVPSLLSFSTLTRSIQIWYKRIERKWPNELPLTQDLDLQQWIKQDPRCQTTVQREEIQQQLKELYDITAKEQMTLRDHFYNAYDSLILSMANLHWIVSQDEKVISPLPNNLFLMLVNYLVGKIVNRIQEYLKSNQGEKEVPCELLIRYCQDLDPYLIGPLRERELGQMLFEISSTLLVRLTQKELTGHVLQDVSGTAPFIRQALMGVGKSAVVVPFVTFLQILDNERKGGIIVQPPHLVQQTRNTLTKTVDPLLSLRAHIQITTVLSEVKIKKREEIAASFSPPKPILIADDGTLKTWYLEEKTNPTGQVSGWFGCSEVFCLMDEVDLMYNPFTSQLNFPVTAVSHPFVEGLPIDSIPSELIRSSSAEAETKTHFSLQLKGEDIKRMRLVPSDTVFLRGEKLILEQDIPQDRYSFVQYEGGDIKPKRIASSNRFPPSYEEPNFLNIYYDFVIRLAEMSYDMKQKSWIPIETQTIESLLESISLRSYQPLRLVNSVFRRFIQKIQSSLRTAQNAIFQLHYGLVDYEYLAIPFLAENTPAPKGTIFQDVDLVAFLTCFAYREVGISESYKRRAEEYLDEIAAYFELERADLIQDITWQTFLRYYVFPTFLRTFMDQRSTSFMELMTSSAFLHRAAFTGTLSILLPTSIKKNMFQGIQFDRYTQGAIQAAIRGIFESSGFQTIHPIQDREQLLALVTKGNFQVVMDAAAFLKSDSVLNGVPRFVSDWFHLSRAVSPQKNLEGIIFVDHSLLQKVYLGPDRDPILLSELGIDLTMSIPGQFYYFYPQSRTIGTDLPQPFSLHGLCLFDMHNTLTQISQAVFRMRLVNRGHTVVFAQWITPGQTVLLNRESLWESLRAKEEKGREELMKRHLYQNFFLLYKEEQEWSISSYQTTSYYYPVNITLSEYLSPYQVKTERARRIQGDLLLHYLDEKDNIDFGSQEQQHEQEQARQTEQQQEHLLQHQMNVLSQPCPVLLPKRKITFYEEDYFHPKSQPLPVVKNDQEVKSVNEPQELQQILPRIWLSPMTVWILHPNTREDNRKLFLRRNLTDSVNERRYAYFYAIQLQQSPASTTWYTICTVDEYFRLYVPFHQNQIPVRIQEVSLVQLPNVTNRIDSLTLRYLVNQFFTFREDLTYLVHIRNWQESEKVRLYLYRRCFSRVLQFKNKIIVDNFLDGTYRFKDFDRDPSFILSTFNPLVFNQGIYEKLKETLFGFFPHAKQSFGSSNQDHIPQVWKYFPLAAS
jgi:hypothetical protein